MQNNPGNKETWPDELDALKAAPQHYKLLFENDMVRVIDACIPAGEITNTHTHKWPSTLYYISGQTSPGMMRLVIFFLIQGTFQLLRQMEQRYSLSH